MGFFGGGDIDQKARQKYLLLESCKNGFLEAHTFLSSLLPGPVYMVLKLDSDLPFIWLVTYKWMFQ